MSGTVNLAVEILDHAFKLVNAGLSVDAKFFENLKSSIIDLIKNEILGAPGVWLTWVEKGLISIAKSIAEVLKDIFNISSWEDAAKLMWDAGFEFAKILDEIVVAFDVAVADVAAFLESLAKDCAMETVNGLTSGSARFNLFAAAQDTLLQISPRGDGQILLYLFYSNKNALEQAIGQNPQIWHGFVGATGDTKAPATAPHRPHHRRPDSNAASPAPAEPQGSPAGDRTPRTVSRHIMG